jgi:hypothetical protein
LPIVLVSPVSRLRISAEEPDNYRDGVVVLRVCEGVNNATDPSPPLPRISLPWQVRARVEIRGRMTVLHARLCEQLISMGAWPWWTSGVLRMFDLCDRRHSRSSAVEMQGPGAKVGRLALLQASFFMSKMAILLPHSDQRRYEVNVRLRI